MRSDSLTQLADPQGALPAPRGATNGAKFGAIDAAFITWRLEEAGATLLSLPFTGFSTKLAQSRLDVVRCALEAYGWAATRLKPAVPDPARISRMDESFAWLGLIPPDRYVLRRIVGARALVSPLTGRHLFPWRRLGALLGADHKAIQRWHGTGIALIATALRANEAVTR